jgi:hypothetical protein
MFGDERSMELERVVGAVLAEWEAWLRAPDTLDLPPLLDDAVDAAGGAYGAEAVAPVFAPIAGWVAALRGSWRAWRAGQAGEEVYQLPADPAWWKPFFGLQECYDALHEGNPIKIESIKLLMDQRVSPTQICKMYGWVDQMGRAQLQKLEEETNVPGTHTKDYVCDAEKNRRRKIAVRAQKRAELTRLLKEKLNRLTTPNVPESLAELIAQRVSGEQICKMMMLTAQQLGKLCDEQGLDEPPWRYTDVRTARAPHEPRMLPEAEAAMDAYIAGPPSKADPETTVSEIDQTTMTEEDQIRYLSEQGFNRAQIVNALGIEDRRVEMALRLAQSLQPSQ